MVVPEFPASTYFGFLKIAQTNPCTRTNWVLSPKSCAPIALKQAAGCTDLLLVIAPEWWFLPLLKLLASSAVGMDLSQESAIFLAEKPSSGRIDDELVRPVVGSFAG